MERGWRMKACAGELLWSNLTDNLPASYRRPAEGCDDASQMGSSYKAKHVFPKFFPRGADFIFSLLRTSGSITTVVWNYCFLRPVAVWSYRISLSSLLSLSPYLFFSLSRFEGYFNSLADRQGTHSFSSQRNCFKVNRFCRNKHSDGQTPLLIEFSAIVSSQRRWLQQH